MISFLRKTKGDIGMIINYKTVQSNVKPELIDDTSSKRMVYLRRNIVSSIEKDENDGSATTIYTYEEAKLTKEEYDKYLAELSIKDIQQQIADIDYIALMLGIDLEV